MLGALAVVMCLVVNLTGGVASTGDRFVGGENYRLQFDNLAFYTSAVSAA